MSVPDDLAEKIREIGKKNPKLFLDYDGTLVPIKMDPKDCYPDEELMGLMASLSKSYDTYIITGRSLEDITEFVGSEMSVIALHGAIGRVKGEIVENIPDMPYFKEACNRMFSRKEELEAKYKGLRMYNKDGNLLFHLGLIEEMAMKDEIIEMVNRFAEDSRMEAHHGKMIIELRIPGMNKGRAVGLIKEKSPAIIAGDDITDEESFRANPDALRIKVGEGGETSADYTVKDYREMREILSLL